jgi:serine phosphatase RsbU (regulator of sigma subunit)
MIGTPCFKPLKKGAFCLICIVFCSAGVFAQVSTGQPPHTPFSEIFKGDGDEGIVCYKQKHRNYFFVTFALVSALGLVTLNQYKIKRNSARDLKSKNEIIVEKNKDITDSINYARRIQHAILPEESLIKSLLPDSFIFYQPKDIVSGDFYWIAEKNDELVIVVADCTGHGVPGALMSMIGNAFLSEIVLEKGITIPGHILDHLRDKVILTLKQGSTSDSKDGMDIALISLKKEEKGVTLQFAGANNPLWVFSQGELKEIKGDKQPIGVREGAQVPFTNHVLKVEKDACVYLFSDGYSDQFGLSAEAWIKSLSDKNQAKAGGATGKKFRSGSLQKLIVQMASEPMSRQKEIIERSMKEWKGGLEQVDDMLVMGIRI